MRIVVIGGTGHIGTFLIPSLVAAGHDVTYISRGQRQPYSTGEAWDRVQTINLDRKREEEAGTFGGRILALNPDVVVDLICFTPESAAHLVKALRGRIQHFLHCGTIWIHGPSVEVPTTESQPRCPFGDYGIRKAAIETLLLQEALRTSFPVTLLHPGHIVGPGWPPINPAGHLKLNVWEILAQGRELPLPNLGLETLHHVHAADVAYAFELAIAKRGKAIGQSFHVVSPAALTLRGYAEQMAAWFGKPAVLSFQPFDQWKLSVDERDAALTWDHIAHSPCCSIAKARQLLDYQPRYTSLQAVQESIKWLIDAGRIRL